MFYILILFFSWIDLLTKYLSKIYLIEQKNLISNFLYFKYVENTGIAFWIPLTWYFLKIITILLIVWIYIYYIKEEKQKNNKLIYFSFIFILAWGLWNWYERIVNSKVIDFIWVRYFSVFNLADIFITIWAILYILSLYKIKYEWNK